MTGTSLPTPTLHTARHSCANRWLRPLADLHALGLPEAVKFALQQNAQHGHTGASHAM